MPDPRIVDQWHQRQLREHMEERISMNDIMQQFRNVPKERPASAYRFTRMLEEDGGEAHGLTRAILDELKCIRHELYEIKMELRKPIKLELE